jgi:hypothetical protein
MQLFRQGRLSVQKVSEQEWNYIIGLSNEPGPGEAEEIEPDSQKKQRKRKER